MMEVIHKGQGKQGGRDIEGSDKSLDVPCKVLTFGSLAMLYVQLNQYGWVREETPKTGNKKNTALYFK